VMVTVMAHKRYEIHTKKSASVTFGRARALAVLLGWQAGGQEGGNETQTRIIIIYKGRAI
jgi:hypothetical protein